MHLDVESSRALLGPVGKVICSVLGAEMARLRGAKGGCEGWGGKMESSQLLRKAASNSPALAAPLTINLQYFCSGIEVKKGKGLAGSYAVARL